MAADCNFAPVFQMDLREQEPRVKTAGEEMFEALENFHVTLLWQLQRQVM